MPHLRRSTFLAAVLGCAVVTALSGQQVESQRPIPYPVVPSPQFQAAVAKGTRTMTGEPGPNYWQQWTRYTLRARLEPDAKRLEGHAQIVYFNRSPEDLATVALHLYQNLHAEGAVRNEPAEVTGGVELRSVTVSGQALQEISRPNQGSGYFVQGTILRVRPPHPVAAGDSLVMEFDWSFTIPQSGAGGRMGWSEGDLFHIAYWYPQMAVFDDVVGLQDDQFLSNAEFYVGFGDYQLTVEAPAGWVVMASGALLNPQEVLADPVLARYRRAMQSDTVVHVLAGADFGPGKATRTSAGGYLEWRFAADSLRDVAFSATKASNWDAARTPVGDRDGDGSPDYALINSFWRASATRWSRDWRYAQHSIAFLSRWTGIPYPWPHMTTVEGAGIIGGGMEFPMMTLMGAYNRGSDAALYSVTAHELAHMWVPMIVGTDESRYSWMDEGTTSFNGNQAENDFDPANDHEAGDVEGYLRIARAGLEGEIMRRSDYHYSGAAYGTASYSKPATLLRTLRGLLGEETFVRAFRTYLHRWEYKHPKPWDFFNTFNDVSGQDLGWFWRAWYYEDWTLDQAVESVVATPNGVTVTVRDLGWVPMPARLTIRRQDGETLNREIPVDTWLRGATEAKVEVPAGSPVVRVEIDAEHWFPDIDRRNNVWDRDQRSGR